MTLGGWVFWLTVSMFTSPDEVGFATTALSIANLIGGLLGLGLEYPLMRELAIGRRSAFGTILAFEMLILLSLSPVMYFIGVYIYGTGYSPYMTLGVGLLLFSGLAFVGKFSALAILETRYVVLYDVLAIIMRFVVGVVLVVASYGGLGIVAASLVQASIVGMALTLLCISRIGFAKVYPKELIHLLKIGIGNFPSRLVGIMTNNLSIVFLAVFTSNPVEVGLFFIAIAISFVAAGFASSLATMALPVSSMMRTDASTASLRLGLAVTSPLLAAIFASPGVPLSLISPSYIEASETLRILALAMLLIVVVTNVITRLNHLQKLKQLTALGLVHLSTFLVLFPILTVYMGAIGAPIVILLSSAAATIYSLKWLGRRDLRSLAVALLIIASTWILSIAASSLPPSIIFALSLTVGGLINLMSGELTLSEVIYVLKTVSNRT
ncbi:MAG: hypothetical protein NZ920_06010 [Aigarchaeota archaeon]|nr:hypothetical protein [Aigarchaeota archaeon]MDW8092661.1 hypothetical protein [Nitrososphaerota archaeon]